MSTAASNTPGPTLPKPHGKTRAEFIADAMADGVTNLGTAMALADAAAKRNGYRITYEQAYVVTTALAAARLALAHEGSAAPAMRADALAMVNDACAAIAKATGEAQ
jgi:hypothetical protein